MTTPGVIPHPDGLTAARAFVASRVKTSLTAADRDQLQQMQAVYGQHDPSLDAAVTALLAP